MKREEAIRELKIFSGTTKTRLSANFWKALEMAIKALEQEPCEDAVSRQAVLEYIEGSDAELGHSSENKLVCQDIKEFPSVTPTKCIATVKFSKEDMQELVNEKIKEIVVERKKGKWIGHGEHCENYVLTQSAFGAWLMRRDENKAKQFPTVSLSKVKEAREEIEQYGAEEQECGDQKIANTILDVLEILDKLIESEN